MSTIVVNNQTAVPVPLTQLNAPNQEIPASGSVELTLWNTETEIQEDVELASLIAGGTVLLTVDTIPLNQQDSQALVQPPVIGVLQHSDLEGVASSDHHDNSNDPTAAQKASMDNAAGGALSGANPVSSKAYVDALVTGSGAWADPVIDKDLTVPPGSPNAGDRYLIVGVGTGSWLGHDGEIAEWSGSAWAFATPIDGTTVTVQDEDAPYTQTQSVSPWAWVLSGGATAIHGNEKHSPAMLTVGAARSDNNLDVLTGGPSANGDGLHTHTRRHLDRLYFFDDFLGKDVRKFWEKVKSGGGSKIDLKPGIGGQLLCTSGHGTNRSVRLTWDDNYAIGAVDSIMRARIRREHTTDSYTEIGLQPAAGSIRFTATAAGNWIAETNDGTTATTTDTGVVAGGTWAKVEIRVASTTVSFYVDDVLKATHTTNIPAGDFEPYVYQKTTGGTAKRNTWVDYIEIDGAR